MVNNEMPASAPEGDSVRPFRTWQNAAISRQTNLKSTGPAHPGTRLRMRLARALLSASVVMVASFLTLLFGEIFVRVFVPTERLVPLNEVILGVTAQRPGISGIHVVPHTFQCQLLDERATFSVGEALRAASRTLAP